MATMQSVSSVMLSPSSQSQQQQQQQPLPRLLIGKDAFALADGPTGSVVHAVLQSALSNLQQQQQQWPGLSTQEVQIAAAHPDLAGAGLSSLGLWLDVFRVCQVRRCVVS